MGYSKRMDQPKRRFLERAPPESANPTIIAADTVFVGNFRGTGPFVVSGEIHGDGALTGALYLATTASWFGNVSAQHAVIAGKLTGDLKIVDKLEIGATAVIRGRVSARMIAIAKGAIVDGEIDITSGLPVTQFEEKRRSR